MNGRPVITPQAGTDLVRTLEQRVSLAETLSNPDITLARASGTYILYKRKRLTPATERGYRAALDDFTAAHPNGRLAEFAPPVGSHLIEDYLGGRYGHLEPRTYNKAHSVLCDFFKWHVARGTIARDPMLTIERAKTRQVLRQTFTDAQVIQILAANTAARDQIALRLLLFFGIRKGEAMSESLELAAARLGIARAAASTQFRIEPTEAIGEHGLHLWWYRCLTKAGIVASGTTAGRKMHGARHTAIQRVLNKTGNLKAAQALAGHAHISTTGDTYTDWSPEQQAQTMREVLA